MTGATSALHSMRANSTPVKAKATVITVFRIRCTPQVASINATQKVITVGETG